MSKDENLGEKKSVTPADPGTGKSKDTTKAFAARLAREKAKIIAAEREKIAKENGYANYDDFVAANLIAKVNKDTHYDPTDPDFEKLLKILNDRIDPEKDLLKAELEGYREAEAKRWNDEQLNLLKDNYGVDLTSLDELDDEVKERIGRGIDPVDAYYLVHKPKPVSKKQTDPVGEKDHLKGDPNKSSGDKGAKVPTPEEIAKVKEFLQTSDLTDDEVKDLIIKSTG